jgi:two-component system phosphate regulon sensor histidine kinase PhoR
VNKGTTGPSTGTLEPKARTSALRGADLFDTLERHIIFYKRIARLYAAGSITEVCEKLEPILAGLVKYRFMKVLLWDSALNRYYTAMATGGREERERFHCEQAILEWAMGSSFASVVPIEDDELLRRGARSLLLLPIHGRQKGLGIIVVWGDLDATDSNPLLLQSLDILGKSFGGIMENISLTQRYQHTANMLDDIIESVPHAMIAVDEDNRIISCNRNAEFLFDFKRAFILGEQLKDILPPQISQAMASLAISAVSGNEQIDYELDYTLPDNSEITMGISASQLHDRDGRVRGALFICRDMSLSREVLKLRELDQMKNEFVHTVSHELKTPLTAIMGGSEILGEDDDQLDEQQREILDIITQNACRLKELINDLLDLSKLETGRLSLDFLPCDLYSIAAEVTCLFSKNKNDCEIIVDALEDLPAVSGDPDKLRQVFQNIIGNAVKYSPRGGEVNVSFEWNSENATAKVTDRGIGIPKDQLPFIWDKFYRVDSSTTSNIEGTGLGLAITRHIVELHGGSVDVTSEPGRGSTFSFSMPLN